MPIIPADIKFLLSTKSGSVGHSQAQDNPSAALGRWASTTLWAGGVANDLFDDVTGSENLGQVIDYRCVFVWNSHATLTLQNARVWIPSQVAGGADVSLGGDPTAASDLTSGAAQAVDIADENTAPAGVAFVAAASLGAAINLGDIAPGKVRGFWLRREARNTSALAGDGVTIRVTGETLP